MCKRNVLTIAAMAVLALAIGQVQAVTVTVPIDNPGFEDPAYAEGSTIRASRTRRMLRVITARPMAGH